MNALNQVGQQSITVTGIPVGITRPPVTTGELTDPVTGLPFRMTVNRMLVTVHNQPVRWRADGTSPTGAIEDNLLEPGERLNWTDPHDNYRAAIDKIQFVLDTTATGNAQIECAFFA